MTNHLYTEEFLEGNHLTFGRTNQDGVWVISVELEELNGNDVISLCVANTPKEKETVFANVEIRIIEDAIKASVIVEE